MGFQWRGDIINGHVGLGYRWLTVLAGLMYLIALLAWRRIDQRVAANEPGRSPQTAT